MRKTLYIILLLVVSFIFINVEAKTIEELPPIIHVEGIDSTSYNIEKTISDDEVTINLKNKSNLSLYSWSFNKNQVSDIINLNFELKFNSDKKALIDQLATKNKDKLYLSFTHHGDLPSTATIRVYVGNQFNNGEELYLYYYDEENNKLEYVSDKNEVIDGYVEFKINHCSEYFLTGAVVNSEVSSSKTLNYIIGVLFLIVFGLVAVTLFSTKK